VTSLEEERVLAPAQFLRVHQGNSTTIPEGTRHPDPLDGTRAQRSEDTRQRPGPTFLDTTQHEGDHRLPGARQIYALLAASV